MNAQEQIEEGINKQNMMHAAISGYEKRVSTKIKGTDNSRLWYLEKGLEKLNYLGLLMYMIELGYVQASQKGHYHLINGLVQHDYLSLSELKYSFIQNLIKEDPKAASLMLENCDKVLTKSFLEFLPSLTKSDK